MVASGFAALGYQIVWTQPQSALWLGHESTAVFCGGWRIFIGLAAVAMILGQRITEH
jgi:spermidine synthase